MVIIYIDMTQMTKDDRIHRQSASRWPLAKYNLFIKYGSSNIVG